MGRGGRIDGTARFVTLSLVESMVGESLITACSYELTGMIDESPILVARIVYH